MPWTRLYRKSYQPVSWSRSRSFLFVVWWSKWSEGKTLFKGKFIKKLELKNKTQNASAVVEESLKVRGER